MAEDKKAVNYVDKFRELTSKPISLQTELFLKSFIFDLNDDWKVVETLEKQFRARLRDANEGKDDLNPVMAADFLQKNGLERTALERKEEIKDIDLDQNDRIAFIEYLLLHFKVMILKAYYKRHEQNCPHDFSRGGIGVTGVGAELLEELFTMPMGLDPELEAAIEEFTAQKNARLEKMKQLEDTAAKGGVKGLAAVNEIKQIESQDTTWLNRMEITLNAAKKRASKNSGAEALAAKQAKEEAEARAKQEASRAKLKAKTALWEQGQNLNST